MTRWDADAPNPGRGLRRRARRNPPPVLACRGGCGRRRGTWASSWLCRWCLAEEHEHLERESFRATRRRLAGRCAVCGGPWPDGSGCEFCPVMTPAELELELLDGGGEGGAAGVVSSPRLIQGEEVS